MFEQLFNSPLLYSLSLTLLHFLWQGLLVALTLKSALFIIDTNKPKLRYALATIAMLANAVLAILTFVMVYPDTSASLNSNLSPIPLTNLVNELTQQNTLYSYQELLPSILAYSLPYLAILWLATITMLAGKLLIEVRNVNNLPVHSSITPPSALLARFDELAKQISLAKTPQLLISLKAEVPMAIGWLKPVVLLPASMVTGLAPAQLEMLILHELAHIRRHDYLVNFLQTLIELLFFFHPSVHWVGKQMRNEREYCSDDIAVQQCGDAIAYAHTLTDTASLCSKRHLHTIPAMAMAASGGDLKARVLRLVDHHCAPSNLTSKWLAAISLLLALTLLSINQLLTLPFAHQLNNQFPWQQNSSFANNIVHSRLAISDPKLGQRDNIQPRLSKDSIAQQLLMSKKTSTQASLSEVVIINGDTNATINNELSIIPAINDKLQIDNANSSSKPALALSSTKIKVEKITPIDTVNATFVDYKKTLAKQSLSASSAKAQLKVNPAKNNIEVEFISKSIALNNIEQESSRIPSLTNASDRLRAENKVFKKTKAEKAIQLRVSPTALDTLKAANQFIPVNFNDSFDKKNIAYTPISYRHEISQLAIQNDLYQTSYRLPPTNTQATNTSKITFTKQAIHKPVMTHAAKLLNSISPIYPSVAKRRGIEMEVQVNFTIDRNGRVKDIQFGHKNKLIYFKSAIRTAIRKWRFSPATKGGEKVKSKMSKIFSFSLHA
ncbi:M56 family metallopeptidase [Colwellia piezophila]|uniref:M56 family metallopeptidase n=1 Tax=Colwellia piezophila TaxID=211668 RepID=UPI00037809D5|nr:M56 family metallopeptidase [Colwellia piezophila]